MLRQFTAQNKSAQNFPQARSLNPAGETQTPSTRIGDTEKCVATAGRDCV
jgi:hypothetical protein